MFFLVKMAHVYLGIFFVIYVGFNSISYIFDIILLNCRTSCRPIYLLLWGGGFSLQKYSHWYFEYKYSNHKFKKQCKKINKRYYCLSNFQSKVLYYFHLWRMKIF